MFLQVKEQQNWVRDTESGALLNTSREELEAYYAKREIAKQKEKEKQALENKVDKLEEDITQIKELLQQLVSRT
jgi:hypothetical protein